ncbi:hypothetical protein F7725_002591 [Dissostichus mawsoni]|uniref:Uncharacterized protein n=1 Tax=Dissostichus mawsoni TaxID=36200 RepID=A0A7J5Y2T2_DISMA|nr:hypothetical protein F7725_002591 [Dissostichus mawsoni]
MLTMLDYMKSNSSLNPPYFQFTLFADFGPLRYLFFILCLFIYSLLTWSLFWQCMLFTPMLPVS